VNERKSLDDFKAFLRFKNIPYRVLADELCMATGTFSNKINNVNGQEFLHSEIIALSKFLNLTDEQVIQYFFNNDLRNAS